MCGSSTAGTGVPITGGRRWVGLPAAVPALRPGRTMSVTTRTSASIPTPGTGPAARRRRPARRSPAARRVRRRAPAGGNLHPAQDTRRQHHGRPRQVRGDRRLLLGPPLRHEPTSRVPARNARLRARLRLPAQQGRLAGPRPYEGEKANEARAVDVVRTDVVTCHLVEKIADARASPYGSALVLTGDQTLLGRLPRAALQGDDSAARRRQRQGPRRHGARTNDRPSRHATRSSARTAGSPQLALRRGDDSRRPAARRRPASRPGENRQLTLTLGKHCELLATSPPLDAARRDAFEPLRRDSTPRCPRASYGTTSIATPKPTATLAVDHSRQLDGRRRWDLRTPLDRIRSG